MASSPSRVKWQSLTVTVEEAAVLLGIGRGLAYEIVRAGEFPTPILKLGRRVVVPLLPLMELLGVQAIAAERSSARPNDMAADLHAELRTAQESCAEWYETGSISGVRSDR